MQVEFYPGSESNEQTFLLPFDIVFILIAGWWIYCIRPLEKTYLSEIIFPVQFTLRALASLWLGIITWISSVYMCFWQSDRSLLPFFAIECSVWTLSTVIIWMEHRRSLHSTPFLRFFWVFRWTTVVQHIYHLFILKDLWTHGKAPLYVYIGTIFGCITVLAIAGLWPQRELTASSPEVIALTRERLKSFSGKSFLSKPILTNSTYGSFNFGRLYKSAMSEPHSQIEPIPQSRLSLKIHIPSWTLSRRSEASYVSYKILIISPDETWSVRRRYSDFVYMRQELPDYLRNSPHFPEKSLFKRYDPKAIDSRRSKLEKYLNAIVSHPHFDPQKSLSICDFLELEFTINPEDYYSNV